MNKKIRQYIGLLAAVASYYLIHEGAHLLYALAAGVFKTIHVMGLGIQIDIYREQMTNMQLGVFCLVGAAATFLAGIGLVLASRWICRQSSKVFRAILYYITLAMLFVDPVYLGILYSFFGGGDMNGIALLMPELIARIMFLLLLVINGLVFWKIVLPRYTASFQA